MRYVGRRPSGVTHPKLRELVLPDLFDVASGEAQLQGWDACIWAVGISSVGLDVLLFASPQEFPESKRPDVPGCLLLDLRMPGMSGLAFQQELTKIGIELPIIFVTGHGDVPTTVRAMKAGAVEFLTKPFHDQDLLDAVHSAIERDRARRKEAVLVDELRLRYARVTEREREVMKLVVAGRANKQIAGDLELSEVTVKVHRGQVMRKMRARSLPELVRMADRLGLKGSTLV